MITAKQGRGKLFFLHQKPKSSQFTSTLLTYFQPIPPPKKYMMKLNMPSLYNGVLGVYLSQQNLFLCYLQTLGGALTGPSVEDTGGSLGGRHRPGWASVKSGAVAAIFGKACKAIVGRCVVGAEGRVGPESGGREVSPVELLLELDEGGCLWSSLPRL